MRPRARLPKQALRTATGKVEHRFSLGVYGEFPGAADSKPTMYRHLGREAQSLDYWDGE